MNVKTAEGLSLEDTFIDEGFEDTSITKMIVSELLEIPHPDYYKMVIMKFLKGMSGAEIAREMGASEAQVSRGISRALKEMKEGKRLKMQGFTRKIMQYTQNGELVATFNSILEANKATGIRRGNISNCLCGHSKATGGYIWKVG